MRPARGAVSNLLLLAALGLGARLGTPAAVGVRGRVITAVGPVTGACVRWKGTDSCTRTDGAGRFSLAWPGEGAPRLTAWKAGYFIGGADPGEPLRLTPLPATDNEAYAWVAPEPDPAGRHNCGNCHEAIYREWSASSHARAADGRHFRNLYDGTDWHGRPGVGWSLLADNPDGAGVCNACHAPTASFDADLRHLHGVDARGVHCDYCHKVVGTAGTLGVTHGRYGVSLLRPSSGQLFLGPLDDVDRNEDSFLPLYRESRYCAACHEGVVFGVHVYGTYSEWLDSPARREGKQCQTCHMAPTGTLTNLAPGHGGIPRDPQRLASHRFPGGEPTMVRRGVRMLATAAPIAHGVRVDVELNADQAGHRVPTGLPDRNLVLVVEAHDAAGRRASLVAGPVLPPLAGRDVATLPGLLFAKQLADFHGTSPAPFWRAAPKFPDTRLRPGEPTRAQFQFTPAGTAVRVRLLYRRFWPETATTKGWPANQIVVADRLINVVRPAQPARPADPLKSPPPASDIPP